MPLFVFLLVFTNAIAVHANDVYIAQSSSGSANGADCADALPFTYFNTAANWTSSAPTGSKISPGTTVHLCGTITGTAGQTLLTFQGSGTSGAPITLRFEAGAVLQAPYFPLAAGGSSGGGIDLTKRSWIVVDGNNLTGTIRNSLNGSSSATCSAGPCTQSQPSSLISMQDCTNCTVQNLNLLNTYVPKQNDASQANSTDEVTVIINGSNNTVAGNIISNCGWCVEFFFGSGDGNFQAYNNSFNEFGHAFAVAAAGSGVACSSPCSILHDNHIGPAGVQWDASGCPNHKDGVHYFGSGGSTMGDTYFYNNLMDGDWGVCPTGFLFGEAGSSASGMKNNYWWNNVFIVVNTSFENTNGWVNIDTNGQTGATQLFSSNTFIGHGVTDNTLCVALGGSNASLYYQDNVISNCGDPINIASVSSVALDNNLYGSVCHLGNCFEWNGSAKGSFSAWKTACACDAHSNQTASPLLNADGSLQAGSWAILRGANLGSQATGALASLQNDTSKGGTRTPTARPAAGTCSTQGSLPCWGIGAYSYGSSSSGSGPNPPSGLTAKVQ